MEKKVKYIKLKLTPEEWEDLAYTVGSACQLHSDFMMHDGWDAEMDDNIRRQVLENRDCLHRSLRIIEKIEEVLT